MQKWGSTIKHPATALLMFALCASSHKAVVKPSRRFDMAVQTKRLIINSPAADIDAPGIEKNTVHTMDVMDFLTSIPDDESMDLIIIDPPYNIGKNFGNNSDNRNIGDYVDWSRLYMRECFRLAKDAAPIYVYGYPEILAHIAVNFPLQNQRWLAWHYTNKTVPYSKFWQRSFENILCLWKGKKPALRVDDIREEYTGQFLKSAAGKIRKSRKCRYSKGDSLTVYQAHEKGALPRDVIKISALAGGAGYSERILYCKDCKMLCSQREKFRHADCNVVIHPTQKPLKLTEKLIKGSSPANILVPFAGSGSECVVAKKMDVDFYAAEINPDYAFLANEWINTI